MNISVLIHTYNEEKNIRNCLECVKWADEIIVVDMFSEDKTIEIVHEYTDKVYFFENKGYVEPARQFGLNQTRNQWVLVVDADELVPINLKQKLIKITSENKYDAVFIPRKNYFFGGLMQGTGWGPFQDMQLRFFKRDKMKYTSRIHIATNPDPSAKVYTITDESCAFIHFNYIDVEHFLEKLNRYTTIEALNAIEEGEFFSLEKTLIQLKDEFFERFVVKEGNKDGFEGLALALLMSTYRLVTSLKIYIHEKIPNNMNSKEEILRMYNTIAKDEINKYKNAIEL